MVAADGGFDLVPRGPSPTSRTQTDGLSVGYELTLHAACYTKPLFATTAAGRPRWVNTCRSRRRAPDDEGCADSCPLSIGGSIDQREQDNLLMGIVSDRLLWHARLRVSPHIG
jgi:hypothetical protein